MLLTVEEKAFVSRATEIDAEIGRLITSALKEGFTLDEIKAEIKLGVALGERDRLRKKRKSGASS